MNYLGFILIFSLLRFTNSNIHRASPVKGSKIQSNEIIDEVEDDNSKEIKNYKAWIYSIPAAVLVGSTGIFPLLVFRVDGDHCLKEAVSPAHLKLLLSFAVGGLLGDVFLHLLPEAWMYLPKGADIHTEGLKIGSWVIAGLLCFLILEKIFMEEERIKEKQEEENENKKIPQEQKLIKNGTANGHVEQNGKTHLTNGHINNHISNGNSNGHAVNGTSNGHVNGDLKQRKPNKSLDDKKDEKPCNLDTEEEDSISENQIKVIGYLNLLANCIDNFTHGLAVSGSFLVSVPVGVCTTFAILLHEIPHEIGDFAILLKAGFNRWDAAKGQLLTASGALFGCIFGLACDSAGNASAWVLPFTSGGFIYIAMVTVVPDLLKEQSLTESIKQIAVLLAGVATMGLVGMLH